MDTAVSKVLDEGDTVVVLSPKVLRTMCVVCALRCIQQTYGGWSSACNSQPHGTVKALLSNQCRVEACRSLLTLDTTHYKVQYFVS